MSERIIITLGDPNGIGPELLVRLFLDEPPKSQVLLVGPQKALTHHLKELGREPFWRQVDDPSLLAPNGQGIYLWEPPLMSSFQLTPGWAKRAGGQAAGLALEAAVRFIKDKLAKAVVTLPLNKAMFQEAGFNFSGHTEFLAQAAGLQENDVYMHLAGDHLKVSLLTTHPPLKDVPGLINAERIVRCLELTSEFIGRAFPEWAGRPIAVCGLNPHAGESGRIGREEIEIIGPAIMEANRLGLRVVGPMPADTVFMRAVKGEFSAITAMYHDQGLGPLKLIDFQNAVNTTLGLPFIRTSVDHGTAYDLVGRHTSDPTSLSRAIALAEKLLQQP